jgi:hypothetical protein
MNIKGKFLLGLTGLLLVGNGVGLNAGDYSFSGYLPEVVKEPGAVVITIDTPAQQKKFYIHYKTEGTDIYQVRKMKTGKQGNHYHRLSTNHLYGNTVEYFIAKTDKPDPDTLLPVFTITGFAGNGSPEIYFLDAGPGAKGGSDGSKFKFPLDIETSLSTTTRVYDNRTSPGEPFDANGNIGLSRTISGKKSRFDFDTGFSYTHHVDEPDKKINLEDMKVKFKSGKHSFSAGDLAIRNSKFTASSLNRRGLRYKMEGKRFYLGSFFTNAQQKSGFSGFGVPAADAHIFGAEAGFRVGKSGKLHGMFMTGKDNLKSKTVVSADKGYREGSVYSIRGEFKLLKKKLDLKGEFAHSSFGEGAESGSIEKNDDNAWRAEAKFRRGILSCSADYSKIGRHFSSIGNLFLSNDRQGLNSKIDLEIKSFSANLGYKDQKTNVNDEVQPMKHTKDIRTDFTWIIDNRFTVGGSFSLNNLAYDKSSGEETGSEEMNTIQYEANLGYAAGPTGIMFNLGKTESLHFSSDIDASVNIRLKFGKVLSLSPRFSYQSNKDIIDGTTSRIYNAYINGKLTLVPDYFSLTITLSGGKNVYPDGDSTNFTANGNLYLALARLFKQKIKPTLSLKSKYQNRRSKNGSKKSYVIFYLQFDLSF